VAQDDRQGREFLGKAAKKAGLVDAVGTYEDAMSKAQSLRKKGAAQTIKSKFGATNTPLVQASVQAAAAVLADNVGNIQGNPMHALSVEQLAAMAAGVELPVVQATEQAAATAPAAAAAATAPAAAAPAAELTAGNAPIVSEAVTMLQGMLATANKDLLAAQVEAKASAAALAALQAAQAPAIAQAEALAEVVRASVRTMGIHFGVNKESVAAMTATEALAEHARLSAMFTAKFKVGGVAATTLSNQEAEAAAPTMSACELEAAMKLPRANK